MSIVTPEGESLPGPWNSRFALPAEPERVWVSAQMAGDWLDNRYRPGKDTHSQRRRTKSNVDKISALMLANQWPLTHEGLAFDINGWLMDGQHRLQALRNAAQTNPDLLVEFWIFPDQDPANFDKVNLGLPRRAHQLYRGPHGKLITSAARYLVPGSVGKYAHVMNVSDQLKISYQWSELDTWAPSVYSINRRSKIPGVQHLAVLAQASRTAHRQMIEPWIDGLYNGWELVNGDVRGHLRNRAWRDDPLSQNDTYDLLAKAWNLYVLGEHRQYLKINSNETGKQTIIGFEE